MKLTRRDALAALAATGAGVGGGTLLQRRLADRETGPDALAALTAAAEVVYPDEIDGHAAFVETFVLGRIDGREEYYAGLRETLVGLDNRAREWFDAPFVELPPAERDALLDQVGADAADPAPDGSFAERTRYFVVNELLYALYASPKGGRLAGIENPVGHPGGLESYRRGSMASTDGDGDSTTAADSPGGDDA